MKSTLRRVYLDHAESFQLVPPDRHCNPFIVMHEYQSLCRFRKVSVEHLLSAVSFVLTLMVALSILTLFKDNAAVPLHDALSAKLSSRTMQAMAPYLVVATQRLHGLANHMRACLRNFSHQDVMFF